MKKRILAPSILSADLGYLADQVKRCEQAGADWIHIDVMDGHFVPPISYGPRIVEACKRASNLPLDVHLMVENPDRQIEMFAKSGADLITVHQEASSHLDRTLNVIKALGAKSGVSINPATPAETLSEVIDLVDLILVMTVNPGFGGQKFIPSTLKKVSKIRTMLDLSGSLAWLEVDGGVGLETLPALINAGADAFVAGSSVFNAGVEMEKAIANLKLAISG
ncbi:MAG TPA: ribulose-phosphate 3-epimerase [Anaerolineales bacterium]|nr:ribulose-phosphate 3-epimerase [Anaerolineales bacterium]